MILKSLRDLLVVQCRGFLQKLDMAAREDVYALSLYVDAGDTTEPELVLSFNTAAQITRALAGQTGSDGLPSNEIEARWNYAFWLRAPNLRCLVPRESVDGGFWQQLLAERGISYSDSDDFDIEGFETSVKDLLNEVAVAMAREMHRIGSIREVFDRDLPILIHGLEYGEDTAQRTASANPKGLSADFCEWCEVADLEKSYDLFRDGREAFDQGDFEPALGLFQQCLGYHVHFKTLELIGDSLCHLGRHQEAIVPLAAAAGLNRGSRPPCLLAEAFAALGDWENAKDAAEEALRRTANYRRATKVLDEVEQQLANRYS